MTKSTDLTNTRFGLLIVIKRHPVNTSAGKSRWVVKCDCGRYKVVVGGSLIAGLTTTCGKGEHIADRSFQDLAGKEFGDLFVLGRTTHCKSTAKTLWLVRCVCGNEETFTGKTLMCGKRTKCSNCRVSSKRKEETGKIYGKWTVISLAHSNEKGRLCWLCECECGNQAIVDGANLRNGASSGCRVCGDSTGKNSTHGLSNTPEYAAWSARKRIERKKLLDVSWTIEMEMTLRDFFSACVLCGEKTSLDVDHFLPLNLGFGLFYDNALILCGSCNSKKQRKYITELPIEVRKTLIDASCAFQDYIEYRMLYVT